MKLAARLLIPALGAATLASPAAAQFGPSLDFQNPGTHMEQPGQKKQTLEATRCASSDHSVTADMRIAACSALINSGQWKGKEISWAYANRCVAYNMAGKKAEALADCSQAVALDPENPTAHQIIGVLKMAAGENDIAVSEFNAALAAGAENMRIHLDRGDALLALGDADGALAEFDKLVQLNAANATAYMKRGSALLARGDFGKAADDFAKAGQIAPTNWLAAHNLGVADFGKGDKAKAVEDFRHSLSLNPANAYAGLWLFLAQNGDDRAELKAAAAHFKGEWPGPVVRVFLGEEKAEAVLAAAKTPGDQCEAAFYLGEIRLKQGARDAATELLRKAVDVCPKNYTELFEAQAELNTLAPAKAEAAPAPAPTPAAAPAAPEAAPAPTPAAAPAAPEAPAADKPKN